MIRTQTILKKSILNEIETRITYIPSLLLLQGMSFLEPKHSSKKRNLNVHKFKLAEIIGSR